MSFYCEDCVEIRERGYYGSCDACERASDSYDEIEADELRNQE